MPAPARFRAPASAPSLWRVDIPETMRMPAVTITVRHTADEMASTAALYFYNRARRRAGLDEAHQLPALTTWHEITDHNREITAHH